MNKPIKKIDPKSLQSAVAKNVETAVAAADDRFATAEKVVKTRPTGLSWSMSTILTARRQLSWPVEAGNEFDCLCG